MIRTLNVFFTHSIIHPIFLSQNKKRHHAQKTLASPSHMIGLAYVAFVSRCLPSRHTFMYKHHRNASFRSSFFVRQQFWPLLVPSIAILFLIYCPHLCQSIQINPNDGNQPNENPDRTVAKRGPREVQLKSTASPLPRSIPSASSAPTVPDFDDPM